REESESPDSGHGLQHQSEVGAWADLAKAIAAGIRVLMIVGAICAAKISKERRESAWIETWRYSRFKRRSTAVSCLLRTPRKLSICVRANSEATRDKSRKTTAGCIGQRRASCKCGG